MDVRVLLQGEAEKPMAKLHMEKKKEMLLQRRTSLKATVLEQKQFLELLSFELQDIESKIKEINEDSIDASEKPVETPEKTKKPDTPPMPGNPEKKMRLSWKFDEGSPPKFKAAVLSPAMANFWG